MQVAFIKPPGNIYTLQGGFRITTRGSHAALEKRLNTTATGFREICGNF